GSPVVALRSSDRLTLTLSAGGVTVGEGLEVTLSVSDTTGFRRMDILFQDHGTSSTTSAPHFTFALPVTGAVLDSTSVVAVATFVYPDSVVVASAQAGVWVDPGASPLSFSASPDLHLLSVEDEVH